MPVDVQEIRTRFTKDDRDLQRAFDENERRAQRFASNINRTLSSVGNVPGGRSFLPGLAEISEIIQGIPQVGRLIGGLVSPLTDAAQRGLQFNMMLEGATRSFEGLAGGAQNASRHVLALQKFADDERLRFEGVLQGARYMNIFGFSIQEQIPMLRTWMEALSTAGEINDDVIFGVVRGFGQMKALGRVNAEEMNQLAERGIPAWDLLAKAIGKTVAETRKLGEQGRLRGGPAVEAITAMLAQDPRFKGQLERRRPSMAAQLDLLANVRARGEGEAMRGTGREISATLETALSQADIANTIARGIDTALTPAAGLIMGSIRTVLGGGLSGGLSAAFGMAEQIVPGVAQKAMGTVYDAILEFWEARSPSQKMVRLGQNLMASLIQGMQQGGSEKDRIVQAIIREATRAGIAPELLLAQAQQESGFNNRAVSPKGARGFAQFMPGTGAAYGLRTPEDFADINKMAAAQANHMRDLLDKFEDVRLALAAYNAGAGNVEKFGNRVPPFAETQNYVRSIMGNLLAMRALFNPGGVNMGGMKGDQYSINDPRYREPGWIGGPDPGGGAGRVTIRADEVQIASGIMSRPSAIDYGGLPDMARAPGTITGGIIPTFRGAGQPSSIVGELPPITDGFKQAEAAAGSFYEAVAGGSIDARKELNLIEGSILSVSDQLTQTFIDLPQGIGGIFGDSVRQWDGTLKGFINSVTQGFAQMLLDISAQFVQSGITKFLVSLGLSVLGGAAGGAYGSADELLASGMSFGGGRASGGPVSAGTLYQVNERGVELFRPNTGGEVIPLGSSGGTTQNHYHFHFQTRAQNSYSPKASEREMIESLLARAS